MGVFIKKCRRVGMGQETMFAWLKSQFVKDFQIGIILLSGLCFVLAILPFMIYRFYTGNIVAGILDGILILIIATVVGIGWKSGRTEVAGRFFVVFNCIASILSVYLLGVTGIFWSYIAFSVNFFLTKSLKYATVVTVSAVIFIAFLGSLKLTDIELVSFVVTAMLLGFLTYIIAKRNFEQHKRLELLATIDPLTDTLNRRTMEYELQQSLNEHARNKTPMSLVLFDLDHFKAVNDNYGHHQGDNVLIEFAKLLKSNTRSVDRVFRYGGEEFLLLLKDSGLHESKAVAEAIRIAVEQSLRTPKGAITVSCGVAEIDRTQKPEQWISRADAALYRAKNHGRNRIES